ncbi:uncharacterized protein GIQ15_05424 [Arthroderma uncinatum]|uniref:uncharacterized protein n=1 Tax=Arthroderma uncinatum TaxID=74035 RepID=UPI00144A7971|nr:uncharacterized protein GIQ15_05424 [Arthroderma uncinatum]KAF3480077.1 hypothetical protein GIQ15_05424 [Arthroderma uncinatum]
MHLEHLPLGDADFPELTRALWEAYETPHQPFFRAYCPILNNDREKSIANSERLFEEEYRGEFPKAQWMKVVDTDADNKIVGAALWKIYETDPFEGYDEEKVVADWHPEGSMGRVVATGFLRGVTAPRAKMARRPHIFLNIAFTIPSYRRRGVGALFLQWGVDKADAMGLECWLDATDYGRPVYERYGFINVDDRHIESPMPEGLSETEMKEFEAARAEMLPAHNSCMWRPKGGVYTEGVTEKPWENIEYGRNLLLQLERSSSEIKHPQRKQTVQSDLSQKRQQLKILRQRLDDLGTQAHARATAAANTATPESEIDASIYTSEDEEDILPTPQDSATPENTSSRASTSSANVRDDSKQTGEKEASTRSERSLSSTIPTPPSSTFGPGSVHGEEFSSNTLRSRNNIPTPTTAHTPTETASHPTKATMSTGTFSASAHPAASTPTYTSAAPNPPFRPHPSSKIGADASKELDSETSLSIDRQEQESLTDSLLTLAAQLKTSTHTFHTTLESEKSVLDRAVEGLDKNTSGLESAGQRMGMLRRMSEGRGWWGRMLMYLWIFGLWFVAIMIVYVGPKLRF